MPAAITVTDVAKSFRLVHERNATLKATVFNGFHRTRFEEFWALDGVDLEVPEGSTYGLIGHNGSGKSTLLKCMARIYRPTRGRIDTVGRVSALLELGAGFHPELSGRENVFLNGSILGMSRREILSRFDSIVEFAGLEKFIDTPVKNYSSGMFVRLGFSVAITIEPDILLVDEVLAVGDESFQRRCLDKFAALRDAGHTVVVVSHGLESMRNLCDRVAWLDHGKILGEGQPGQVVEAYLDSVRQDDEAPAPPSQRASDEGWDIDAVDVRGEGGAVSEIRSGQPLDVHVTFRAAGAAPMTMVVDITRADGVHVAGLAHRFDAVGDGPHEIVCSIPFVPFTQGVFDVSVELLDEHRTRTHARRTRAARVTVTDAAAEASGGLVALRGTWSDPDRAPAADGPARG
ncbi:MAG: ABC transporter ATP-binding protein [Acidimicrobiales bacterium]